MWSKSASGSRFNTATGGGEPVGTSVGRHDETTGDDCLQLAVVSDAIGRISKIVQIIKRHLE